MTQEERDMIDAQIGNVGGEEPTMGKLKHKASYGQREDLNESEQEAMDAFLERSKKHRINMQENEIIDAPTVIGGWIPIDKKDMFFSFCSINLK